MKQRIPSLNSRYEVPDFNIVYSMSAASSVFCTSVNFLSWDGSIPAPGVRVYCFNDDGSIAWTGIAGELINKMLPRNNKDNFLCAAVVRESKPPFAVSDAEALKEKLFLGENLLMPVLLAV